MKRRIAPFALVCLLLTSLVLTGCSEESKPAFTRYTLTPQCGVVPLDVEGYAVTSGGNESGDPTGGNANLDIQWTFGDGGTGSTSISYHRYLEPGLFDVMITASDSDGNQAEPIRTQVLVLADSLTLAVESNFPDGQFTTTDTLRLGFDAGTCGIDPTNAGDYSSLSFEWQVTGPIDVVFSARFPEIVLNTPGDYAIRLAVNYPTWAVWRDEILNFTVTGP